MSKKQQQKKQKQSPRSERSVNKVFLEVLQNSHENTCARVSFQIKLPASGLQPYYKENLAHVFFGEFCEISKNIFSYRTPPVAASVKTTQQN